MTIAQVKRVRRRLKVDKRYRMVLTSAKERIANAEKKKGKR